MLDDFITIEEAMNTGLIPESYHNIFSKYKVCSDPKCGYPLVINKNRTIMKCLNPDCKRILASRVLKVYSYFGISDFGPQTAYTFVNSNNIKNIPDALQRAPYEIKNRVTEWFDSPHTMGQILELLSIPNINAKSHKMMDNIKDWKNFTLYVENFGVIKVLSKCGIVGRIKPEWWMAMKQVRLYGCSWEKWREYLIKSSVKDNIPYTSFEQFDADLRIEGLTELFQRQLGGSGRDGAERAEDIYLYWSEFEELCGMVTCFTGNIITQKIVITGDIINVKKSDGNLFDRLEFVDYINKIAIKHGVQFENSVALKSTNFVIADYPSNTRKYVAGMARGLLISSDKFLERVKKGEI